MTTLNSEHLKILTNSKELFNSGHYWETHEMMEDLWIEFSFTPYKDVFWAIIQLSTALYHLQNGSMVGAKSQLANAKEKLLRVQESAFPKGELSQLFNWNALRELLSHITIIPDVDLSLQDQQRLLHFKLL